MPDEGAAPDRTEPLEQLWRRYRTDPLTIVDVGAQMGGSHAYQPLLGIGLPFQIIGFEPLVHRIEERMRHEAAGLRLFPAFIGDGKRHRFYVNSDDATSSLLPVNAAFWQSHHLLSEISLVRVEDVDTQTLDSALRDVACVDYLKLDIQGAELMALRGASDVLKRTAAIHCEVEFAELYEGQPLFSEIELLLRQSGFELIDVFIDGYYAPIVPSGQRSADRLGFADALFFAARSEPWTAFAQALIASRVYHKPGLAERVLFEHDGRHGGDLLGRRAAILGEAATPAAAGGVTPPAARGTGEEAQNTAAPRADARGSRLAAWLRRLVG
jgi:FkbM family methyltransferase